MEVILNADDFGASIEINEAIQRAYLSGVLTSASLMVTGVAFDDAVARAREMPGLAVGLHLLLSDGQPALDPEAIPHLAGNNGRFLADPAAAGLKYYFSGACRQELALEIRVQLERFVSTGLPLSHVNGHQNLHIHPAVFDLLIPLAEQFGASGVRIPRDDLHLALGYDRRNLGMKLVYSVVFGLLSAWCLGRLRESSLKTTRRVYGLLQSGGMSVGYVEHLLERTHVPSAELYFHPTTSLNPTRFGPNWGDLEALLSPRVRRALSKGDFHCCNYDHLGEREGLRS